VISSAVDMVVLFAFVLFTKLKTIVVIKSKWVACHSLTRVCAITSRSYRCLCMEKSDSVSIGASANSIRRLNQKIATRLILTCLESQLRLES
jgi:hypothetical protein